MAVTHILMEQRLLERRAAAFADDVPVALFLESELLNLGPRIGAVHRGILRDRPDALDGGFCALEETGETVFVRLPKAHPPALGAHITVRIQAEARQGKLARASLVRGNAASPTAFDGWTAATAPKADVIPAAGDSRLQSALDGAFDSALSPHVAIAGGGRLTLTRTPALTAIDIDSAGCTAGSRAKTASVLNHAAVETAADALALRGLGGLVVIDCVAPLSRELGTQIKATFLKRFRAISSRKAEALAPSPFGLMEISLAWRETPVGEVLCDLRGAPSPETMALEGLRQLERTAETERTAALVLDLPRPAYIALVKIAPNATGRLAETFGARLDIRAHDSDRYEVSRT